MDVVIVLEDETVVFDVVVVERELTEPDVSVEVVDSAVDEVVLELVVEVTIPEVSIVSMIGSEASKWM